MGRNRVNDPRYFLYWQNQGFSEEESKIKAKNECRKNSVRCVEYWMSKHGLSLEEAKLEVKRVQDHGKSHIGMKRGSEQRQNMRESQKLVNSLSYWINKYGEEIGKIKYEEFCSTRKINAKLGSKKRIELNSNTYIESSIRRPEYWIKQGYTESEAKLMVSKKQSRGVDFYIKKYGEIAGIKKWQARNEKWFNSFYMSGKNLDDINEKRKLNSNVGYYNEDTIKDITELYFYMIILLDTNNKKIIKYGLTKHDFISKRWSVSLNYNLLLFKKLDAIVALELESNFNNMFRHSYSPQIIKTTECFECNDHNLEESIKIIKQFNCLNDN
jgi:hypothetical protein